jgi:hypothetical protein
MKLRLAGGFSAHGVTVWFDEETTRDGDVCIPPDTAKRVDVRAFAGVPVFLHAKSYTDTLIAFVDRIKPLTAFVLVAVADFGADLGWKVVNGETVDL